MMMAAFYYDKTLYTLLDGKPPSLALPYFFIFHEVPATKRERMKRRLRVDCTFAARSPLLSSLTSNLRFLPKGTWYSGHPSHFGRAIVDEPRASDRIRRILCTVRTHAPYCKASISHQEDTQPFSLKSWGSNNKLTRAQHQETTIHTNTNTSVTPSFFISRRHLCTGKQEERDNPEEVYSSILDQT